MLSSAQSAAAAESNAVVTVVTSRCTPESAWRPTDADVIEVPAAGFDPAAFATNENGPVGLAAELAEMIRTASLVSVDQRAHVINHEILLRWSDEVAAAILANGGELRRAFSGGGRYLSAVLETPTIRIAACGPTLYGPLTKAEDEATTSHYAQLMRCMEASS